MQSFLEEVDIDNEKLSKIDKMLSKVDTEIQKRLKDYDKIQFIETLKKTNDIYQLIVGEVFTDKETDTELDKKDARRLSNIQLKITEIDQVKKEIEETGNELDNFLQNRNLNIFDVEKSKAEITLKKMLKDLSIKKRKAEQSELSAKNLLGLQNLDEDTYNNELQNNNAAFIFKNQQNLIQNQKQIIQKETIGIQREEDSKKDKKLVLNDKEKDKFKHIIEDNIRMKLKMRELIDELKIIETENLNNIKRFKNFIMNSNLTDDQKKLIIGKIDDFFLLDIQKRLNIRELEHMSKIDNEYLKDNLIKQIIGDSFSFVKKIKQNEKLKKMIRENPNYDPDFDPNLLDEGQKIITRRVKKMVRKQNSKGEWIEEEIEVDEECVVDKDGNILRTREKPKEGLYTDPSIIAFVNQFGGLAVGGSKFIIPQKPGRPVAKDGQNIKEGEWFTDQNGNKVRMMKNAKGEEEYEVQEEYIDEFGNKQKITKKMIIQKDKDGNEIITESYIDPKTGKLIQVQKKVIKDKNGNVKINYQKKNINTKEIIEEIITDENGNDIVEEEIIDEFGNKTIVRKKKIKDANGNDVYIIETINSDGTKTIVTEKIGLNGERIITEEKISKNGKRTFVEKVIKLDSDGKPVIEESSYDEHGNKIVKNIRNIIDKDGNIVQVEEYLDENGNKITKKTKVITDKEGNKVTVEELIDSNGNKITKLTKQIVDQNGNIITIEEIIDEYGNKITKQTKSRIDKNGNQIIEEEIIDADGNKIKIKKTINKDGTVEEERYNPITGETIIIKKKFDQSGREIIEETRIDKNGNKTTTTKVISLDKNGNQIIEESYIDPKTGKKITVKKKICKDNDGNEIVEETRIDENGNVTIVKKKNYKDKDGNKIIEEEIIGSDGKKYTVKTKIYKDKDGNEIIEEEKIDEFGNKIITKRIKDKDGKEIIEEIKIDKNGQKTKPIRQIDTD
ncbi:phage head-tail family protein, putative [Ichthyophthirius multifiliis]|uniref:Phage head-tail family protein, putative n=1 Tax=Ichthyophthirius multifiliis TaxID=5932 RepID=G0QL56_ICHMU|nr:phage head-tail family protein, putative [Ichthyophthirius multifiliis]EGR34049.1 phage head-tail family protein, putative [Ichthyophthirius multifiliis]|eukprot:XP_004039353.1 phage head-tail family protein, putative [Ichthyophthirius multifiliis]